MTAKKIPRVTAGSARPEAGEARPLVIPGKLVGGGQAVPVPRARIPGDVPTTYADQVVDVVYGVHTSKIVLGVENGSGGVRPVSVVVIPTSTLLIFASTAIHDLSSTRIVEETQERQSAMISLMRRLASSQDVPSTTKKKRAT